jgi:hypothetical protein
MPVTVTVTAPWHTQAGAPAPELFVGTRGMRGIAEHMEKEMGRLHADLVEVGGWYSACVVQVMSLLRHLNYNITAWQLKWVSACSAARLSDTSLSKCNALPRATLHLITARSLDERLHCCALGQRLVWNIYAPTNRYAVLCGWVKSLICLYIHAGAPACVGG